MIGGGLYPLSAFLASCKSKLNVSIIKLDQLKEQVKAII